VNVDEAEQADAHDAVLLLQRVSHDEEIEHHLKKLRLKNGLRGEI
jgi:hypothetical protein